MSKVAEIADPLVDSVDSKINDTYSLIQEKVVTPAKELKPFFDKGNADFLNLSKASTQLGVNNIIVPEQWFATVDAIFAQGQTQLQTAYTTSQDYYTSFVNTCVETYNTLDINGNGAVSREEFIKSLKEKMGKVWDEELVGPAQAYFETFKTQFAALKDAATKEKRDALLASLKEQLQHQWDTKVVEYFNTNVQAPATKLYTAALDYYMTFDQVEFKVNVTDFLTGMKLKLGENYTSNLEQPLREFFAGASAAAYSDLQEIQTRVHAALDHNKDGVLTLGDFVGVAQSSASLVGVVMNGTWQHMLKYSSSKVDYYLPSEAAAVEEKEASDDDNAGEVIGTLSLGKLSSKLKNRLQNKAADGYGEVRKFSSTRLKNLIHIDLIAYAEDVLDNAKNDAKPKYEQVQAKLEQAVLRVKTAAEEARRIAVPNMMTISGLPGAQTLESFTVKMSPYTIELKAKLTKAIERAQALSHHGNQWLFNTQLSKLPTDVVTFISIMSQVVLGKNNSDTDYADSIALLNELMSSVRNLFVWSELSVSVEESESSEKAEAEVDTVVDAALDATSPEVVLPEEVHTE